MTLRPNVQEDADVENYGSYSENGLKALKLLGILIGVLIGASIISTSLKSCQKSSEANAMAAKIAWQMQNGPFPVDAPVNLWSDPVAINYRHPDINYATTPYGPFEALTDDNRRIVVRNGSFTVNGRAATSVENVRSYRFRSLAGTPVHLVLTFKD